jgi:hypothetical protein
MEAAGAEHVREAEHDGGASLVGDEGPELAARPVDLAQVLGVHHRSRHLRLLAPAAGEAVERVREIGGCVRVDGNGR